MNRRQFTRRLAAVFALPALPAISGRGLAAPLAASPGAAAPAIEVSSEALYWAKYLESLHDACTPQQLKSVLNISDGAARSLHGELVAQGVLDDLGAVAGNLKPAAGAPRSRHRTVGGQRIGHRPGAQPAGAAEARPTTRDATPGDIPALADIWHRGWHEAHAAHVPRALCALPERDSFASGLRARLGETVVLVRADEPIGFCMLRGAWITRFHLCETARGGGPADVLMAAALARLRARGLGLAHLHVIAHNRRAIAFFARHGWAGDEIVPLMPETPDRQAPDRQAQGRPFELPHLLMRRELTPQPAGKVPPAPVDEGRDPGDTPA